MQKDTFNQLDNICKEITDCRACSFHRQLTAKGFPYKPDAPFFFTEDSNEYRVITIGINPGWNNESYTKTWKDVYREIDYQKYKARMIEIVNQQIRGSAGRQPYRDSLFYTFMTINEHLKIYDGKDIRKDNLYDYIFWSNLSFCSSSSVEQRQFEGQSIACNVVNEEIPNCLRKGHLKRLIKIIDPRLILFFGYDALNFYHFHEIFDVATSDIKVYDRKQFPAHMRKEATVSATIVACKIKAAGVPDPISVIFLPHPNYRFSAEYKEAALAEVCTWLAQ